MKWPDNTPDWLRLAVSELEDNAERAILQDEPARACGYNAAVLHLKAAIEACAESAEERRMKALSELTFPRRDEPAH